MIVVQSDCTMLRYGGHEMGWRVHMDHSFRNFDCE